jgi:hypothetical protein
MGQAFSVMAFPITAGKIVDIEVQGARARLRRLDLTAFKD